MDHVIPLPANDLENIVQAVAPHWAELRRGKVLVTGASGCFGCWILESLLALNRQAGFGIEILAQSRDPERVLHRLPHFGSTSGIRWIRAEPSRLVARDISDALEGSSPRLDAIVHLVTEADGKATIERPLSAIDAIVGSTQAALKLAVATGAQRFLFTSSGSIYARSPVCPNKIDESFPAAPDPTDLASAYAISGTAKRHAEQLCVAFGREHALNVSVARCFSFVGPHLPLDGKFAIGNFLNDALSGRDLVLQGDGSAIRSYLYLSDLAVWLLTLLLRGYPGRAYNVGSQDDVSIRDVAETVRREVNPKLGLVIRSIPDPTKPVDRYVPSTQRAQDELGLRATVPLDDAVRRTAAWWSSALQH